MENKTKIIALYLPQFHQIPENDEFWGKGFTDWVTVKKAKPLFEGHHQPRIPLNENYYDLSLKENVAWQAQLAKKYGVDGFGVYHYWFNNEKNILTKPAEIIRDNNDIDIDYFFIWDNASWKRSWSSLEGNAWTPVADNEKKEHDGPQILIPYILGRETDWDYHFNEVLKHFVNSKYLKRNNKPLFGIISYSQEILQMCRHWNNLAIESGFDGMEFIFMGKPIGLPSCFFHYSYEPHYSAWIEPTFIEKVYNKISSLFLPGECRVYNYDVAWKRLIARAKDNSDYYYIPGAFVSYDDSPRRGGTNSKMFKGVTPQKFEYYMKKLLQIVVRQQKEFIFLTAWNEWGEGAYLEPDSENKEAFLKALKRAKDLYL